MNALQEEITQKTLALCVQTGKITAQLLQQAMKKVLADMEKHKHDPQLRHGKQTIRIAGDDYPAEVVKSRFLKLTASHIEYILDRMRENTTYVRNIKKYLLAALYNAPVTMDSYYTSLVNHDLYGSGDRSLQIKSQAPIERKVQSGLE